METNEINLYWPEIGNSVADLAAKQKTSDKLLKLAKWIAVSGFAIIFISYLPSFVFALRSSTEKISALLSATVPGEETITSDLPKQVETRMYLPRLDPSLPKENTVTIISVGIKTKIQEAATENLEDALKVGVWRVGNFGVPAQTNRPVILAAHRYGYLKWSIPYRLKNSFYNLPKLKKGEIVEIVWGQRKYIYEVYDEEKGQEISDYSADLILYTCESLNSPVRIFKYARLLEI